MKTEAKYTAFRCPLDLLGASKTIAKKERRSLSNYIITLLAKEAAERGLLKDALAKPAKAAKAKKATSRR